MLQKSPGKSTLFILLVCLLSLGIGVWLGYGIRTQGLLGTAATIDAESSGSDSQNNTRDSSDVLGGARYIYGNEIFLFCKNCSNLSMFPNPLPEGDLLCSKCGQLLKK